MNKRFEATNKRFESTSKRFEGTNKRSKGTNNRLATFGKADSMVTVSERTPLAVV